MPVSTRSQSACKAVAGYTKLPPKMQPDTCDDATRGMLARCLGTPPSPRSFDPPRRDERRPSLARSSRRTEQDSQEQARIMVYVRVRPLSKKERDAGARSAIRVVDKKDIYVTEFINEMDYLRLKRLKGRHFAFDASFPESSGQLEVYNASTAGLIEAVIEGKNASVFCYGATGAGKTYTMLGTVSQPGVMVLALKELFAMLQHKSRHGDFTVRLSYLEVYNEMVRDLLSPGRPLVLREDSKGTVASGLTYYQAYSADEVMLLLQRGNQNRVTEPTQANETSSRSHAILQVSAEYKVQMECTTMTRTGKLSLIDLAGSERALATDQRTIRSLEGAKINRSLLALSSCIKALVEGDKHVPFRDSKLTQLLKDSLGGACQTAMIANITPSHLSSGETQNTLHWADRAKEIRTKVAKEEVQIPASQEDQTKLLLEMQKENQQLRFQLASLQQKFIGLQCSVAGTRTDPLQTPLASPRYTPVRTRTTASARSPCARPREDKASEKSIRDLKKAIEMMEKDSLRMQREHRKKVEEMAATIAALNREKQRSCVTPPSRTAVASSRTVKAQPSTPLPPTAQVTEVKPRPGTRQPLTEVQARFYSPNKADNTNANTAANTSTKKRSFWDIGQCNSPSLAQRTRCPKTSAAPPSMLLQPGFTKRR